MEYIIGIISFLMFSVGLFYTAKYMEKSYAVLSFMPIMNWYVMVSLAGYGTSLFTIICALIIVGWFFIPPTFIVLYIIQAYLLYQVGMRTSGKFFPSILAALLPPIGMLVIGIILKKRGKNEDIKDRIKIKLIKCSNCSVRQQIRVKRKMHTCTDCNTVMMFENGVEIKKSQ